MVQDLDHEGGCPFGKITQNAYSHYGLKKNNIFFNGSQSLEDSAIGNIFICCK